MSRYTPEQAADMVAEARETLRRVSDAALADRSHEQNGADDVIRKEIDLSEPRVESRNMRHRRELELQEKQFRLERMREEVQHERERERRAEAAANADAVQRIADLETDLLGVVRACSTLAEATQTAFDAHGDTIDKLRQRATESDTKIAKLEAEIAKLQLQLVEAGIDRGKTIDLPALPRMQ